MDPRGIGRMGRCVSLSYQQEDNQHMLILSFIEVAVSDFPTSMLPKSKSSGKPPTFPCSLKNRWSSSIIFLNACVC
jgi:hypothetical protein